MTRAEAEWDEQQQGWMLALAAWEESRCRQCGGDLVETTSDEMEDGYELLAPVRCHRCTALSRSEDRYRKPRTGEAPTHHPHALIHRVQPKPPERRRRRP